MIIKSKIKKYKVNFSKNFSFFEELKKIDNSFFVIDKKVFNIYRNKFNFLNEANYLLIEASERKKVIDTVLNIIDNLARLSSKKNTTLISIGGGIIQDITGFTANILYRGIKWVFIPTTLLAQSDSCIGSKTSLNFTNFKNLLGTFYPPDKVIIDINFLNTLNSKDYFSGLGEIFKFSIMNGQNSLINFENSLLNLNNKNQKELKFFILESLKLKKLLIESDEFDKNERNLLNYGHTFGHSIESITNFDIPHGQAVTFGIIFANIISKNKNLIQEKLKNKIEKIGLKILTKKIKDLKLLDDQILWNTLKKDKKNLGENITFILLKDNFKLEIFKDISLIDIKNALNEFKKIG